MATKFVVVDTLHFKYESNGDFSGLHESDDGFDTVEIVTVAESDQNAAYNFYGGFYPTPYFNLINGSDQMNPDLIGLDFRTDAVSTTALQTNNLTPDSPWSLHDSACDVPSPPQLAQQPDALPLGIEQPMSFEQRYYEYYATHWLLYNGQEITAPATVNRMKAKEYLPAIRACGAARPLAKSDKAYWHGRVQKGGIGARLGMTPAEYKIYRKAQKDKSQKRIRAAKRS